MYQVYKFPSLKILKSWEVSHNPYWDSSLNSITSMNKSKENMTHPMSMTLLLNVTVIIQNRSIYTLEISTDLGGKKNEVISKEKRNTLIKLARKKRPGHR